MILLLQHSLSIFFDIQQNESICFQEELPKGTSLRGHYGADQNQYQPSVELNIYANSSKLLRNSLLKTNNTFSFIVEDSGMHQVCFNATAIDSQPSAKRTIFLDLDNSEIPIQSDDKIGTAQAIHSIAKETILDQTYGQQRITALLRIGKKVKSTVFWVGFLSIAVTWVIVVLQNSWLASQVKKRL